VKMHLNSNTVNTETLTEFLKSHFPNTCLKVRGTNAFRRGFRNPFKLTKRILQDRHPVTWCAHRSVLSACQGFRHTHLSVPPATLSKGRSTHVALVA